MTLILMRGSRGDFKGQGWAEPGGAGKLRLADMRVISSNDFRTLEQLSSFWCDPVF